MKLTKGAWAFCIGLALVFVVFITVTVVQWWPQHPFANLEQEDIVSGQITFGGFDPCQLSGEQVDELVASLKDIIIYRKTDYKNINGHNPSMFILKKADGETIRLSACEPLVINGVGYYVKGEDAAENLYEKWVEEFRAEGKFKVSD